MSHESLRPDELAAREAVRGLSPPGADPDFRDRMRREFASGAIDSRRRRRGPSVWSASVAAAAALAIALGVWLNQGARWTVEGISGAGTVVIDGRELAVQGMNDIRRALRPGSRIGTSSDAQLDLRLGDCMAIQLPPGTHAVIPTAPGRWFPRTSRAGVTEGEVRFTTGPGLRGVDLRITTPEARIDVSGTTFAVIREPAGSCVCVLEGEVRMSGRGVSREVVRAGTRRYLFNDGRLPLVEPIRALESMKLTMLRKQSVPRMNR